MTRGVSKALFDAAYRAVHGVVHAAMTEAAQDEAHREVYRPVLDALDAVAERHEEAIWAVIAPRWTR